MWICAVSRFCTIRVGTGKVLGWNRLSSSKDAWITVVMLS
jgi:hypothetical protein